jgi:hypothetical protein
MNLHHECSGNDKAKTIRSPNEIDFEGWRVTIAFFVMSDAPWRRFMCSSDEDGILRASQQIHQKWRNC